MIRGDERHVDREEDHELVARRAEACDEAGEGSTNVGAIIGHRKGKLDRVGGLSNRESLGGGLPERSPRALGERPTVQEGKSFR